MAVHRNDAVGVFRHHIPVGVHAEGPHPVTILFGPVYQLGFVYFVGDVLEHSRRYFHPYAHIHLVVGQFQPQGLALVREPFGPGPSRRPDQVGTLHSFIAILQEHFISPVAGFEGLHLGIALDLDAVFEQEPVDAGHELPVVVRAQVPHFGIQKMQVIPQGLPADFAVLGGIHFPRGAVLQIDFIHIVDQVHDRLLGDVIAEPAAELRGEIILAVGESPGTAKAPHDAAGCAPDAAFHLARDDGAVPEIDGMPFLDDQDTYLGIFQYKFISRIDGSRAAADNGYVYFFCHFLNTSLSLTVLKIMEEI